MSTALTLIGRLRDALTPGPVCSSCHRVPVERRGIVCSPSCFGS